ncbi:hypothetical protein NA56DRAFT_25785 [Hyaloscypha hepaticicola]|uniref:Uncharacterized protein n=1 Tax=Hyaloscypha hepaticicola TaxID=2082293 RepID=A0A2J6QCU1_9HELO|nr:hypothetical protein NA56DRAFT_25785 [Hyaloscypha hepaticicola]
MDPRIHNRFWSRRHLLTGNIVGEVASTQDTTQPSPSSNSTKMVSIADHTFHMLSRHMSNDNEEVDFPLYPDTGNMFSPSFQFNGAQTYNMDASYSYARNQEAYPTTTGLGSSTMYADAPQYESPDLRTAPSNYSTASGPSASSSTIGSPHSIHGHIVPGPEYGLGLTPSIVGYNDYGHNEYTFQASGMDDFTLEFNTAKSNANSFVGECKTISTSTPRQHGSISSLSTFVSSPNTMDTPTPMRSDSATMSMASPVTPASAMRSPDESFKSPSVSAFSASPSSSRRPSQAFSAQFYASSSTAGRPQDTQLSPISSISQPFNSELSPSYTKYHQSPFFSQSSGSFVPPLESSCRFPLSIQRRALMLPST